MAGGEADDSEGAALITTEDVAALAAAAHSDNMVAADAPGAAVEASSTAAPAIPREPAAAAAAVPVSSNNSVGTTGTGATGEDLVHKARGLMRRIVAGRASPNPCLLHALAGILEQEESRYEQHAGQPYSNTSRSSHMIGRLVNLIREDDDFFELLSSRLLVDPVHATKIRAAALRLLLACVSSWMYPHVFEEEVLVNIKRWVIEDSKTAGEGTAGRYSRSVGRKRRKHADEVDCEMLRTYSTGLLAVALGGGDVVEDVLTTGIVGQLMHYLRVRVLGDAAADANTEKIVNVGSACRGRDEARGRVRPVLEVSRMEDIRPPEILSDEQMPDWVGERVLDFKGKRKDNEEGVQEDTENIEGRAGLETPDLSLCTYDADEDGDEWVSEDKRRRKDRRDGKNRTAEWFNSNRPLREDEIEEVGRAEPSKRRSDARDRGGGKGRGKGRVSDGLLELERGQGAMATPVRKESGYKSKGSLADKITSRSEYGPQGLRDREFRDDSDSEKDDIKSVMVGVADISSAIQRAKRAAQAEARAADAPWEAVKAAGDAAAELVKASALEVLNTSNEEEEILSAADKAASTVVDAALSTTVSRAQLEKNEIAAEEALEAAQSEQKDEHKDEHKCELEDKAECFVDIESIAVLRERYCIQCLEKMGEYLEVLGPVLHERGVDVCLALLQRRPKDNNPKELAMLSDVLKLICALAAHRKFAALLVDRGGVQQLLATPRVPQTLTGISLCLFAFASLQGVMERVCTLPASVVQDVVALALHLLGCSQDPARRNAALFFGASFVFRAILDAFDTQDGLRKLVNLLRNTAALRSGGGSSNPGTAAAPPGSRGDRTLAAEVLTSSGKQIAYHTCVALRQYFRAHLLLLVDSLRPIRSHKSGSRSGPSGRATYKPLDISNEAMDAIIIQLQRDRKLGPGFVRARWVPLELFMVYNGHIVLLELTQQAAPGERYLHEIVQHSLGVLQIVSLVPYTRRLIVDSTLSNERSGMAVILDAASGAAFCDPEVIQTALLVLVNLVCPPPSLCSRPMPIPSTPATQPSQASQGVAGNGVQGNVTGSGTAVNLESKGWMGRGDNNADRNGGIPAGPSASGAGVVGDRRISLGPGAGGSGLAAYMEQGYRYAREAVRANNGIKVLLHLLYPRTVLPPAALDCIRALSCRVLLGLARDETIAHILTKLQVGKLLSELLRDGGGQAGRQASAGGIGGEQGRWQAELSRVALELIAIVTNAGRANTVAASEAAAPTLRRLERAAIAAATPISYHPRELLQLIHEHLIGSGLSTTAAALLKEANLKPLPSILPPTSLLLPSASAEGLTDELLWPSGRVSGGFLGGGSKQASKDDDDASSGLPPASARRKPVFSTSLTGGAKSGSTTASLKKSQSMKESRTQQRANDTQEPPAVGKLTQETLDAVFKTPIALRNVPAKRKASERDLPPLSPTNKRMSFTDVNMPSPCVTPGNISVKTNLTVDTSLPVLSTSVTPSFEFTPSKSLVGQPAEKVDAIASQPEALTIDVQQSPYLPFKQYLNTPSHSLFPSHTGVLLEPRTTSAEHATLDSLVVQYLKHQHRQCPAPITTLPPLSLLHPHVCPEPSRALDASLNTAGRLAARQISPPYGGMHGRRRDRHFVYSRFRPWRTCRDDAVVLTANTFLGHASCLAAGSHAGDIRLFDSSTGNILEVQLSGHNSPISLLQSAPHCLAGSGDSRIGQLLLSSASYDVRLWDSSSLSNGPLTVFEGCKAARFNHAGSRFGAIALEASHKEVLLYDVGTYKLEQRLSDSTTTAPGAPRGHTQAMVHFSPDDVLVLWSGVLWDHRIPRDIHRFDQFTDYGGGGFHPAGNEVIINSEVWDLRSFKLLRSVPSLDQTAITFNTTGDVMYATLRRNSDDIMAALHPRRMRHPLFSAFRTMDAVDYSDITTTVVDRCVLDLATEPTDSFISIVAVESNDEMDSFARLYEVGRRRPTDDDSDPDDGGETEEEESEGEDDDDEDGDLHDDEDIDLVSNDDEENSGDDDDGDDDGDGDFGDSSDDEGSDDGLGDGVLELISDGDDDPRGIFSSGDDGSGGEYGDDGFDDMLQGLF